MMSEQIGVPYAMIDVNTGERICPVCEGRFPEDYDVGGEMLTVNYATHYQREHDGGKLVHLVIERGDPARPHAGYREEPGIPRFGADPSEEG